MKHKFIVCLMGLLAFYLCSAFGATPGTWTTTGSMNTARCDHMAILLSSGQVLVAGGNNGSATASAEMYNPSTGAWTTTGSMNVVRRYHTITLLQNGQVLVTGGYNGSSGTSSAELYDPITGTWKTTGSMYFARWYHTATLLQNGQVLVTGGYNGSSGTSGAELYDPTTGTWKITGSMSSVRWSHTAALLQNGQLLVVGGQVAGQTGSGSFTASAELYNPATGAWTNTGSMNNARYWIFNNIIATLLPNGKVLVVGGYDNNKGLSSAELYDPTVGTWTSTGSMSTGRYGHTATLLRNGQVLVAGSVVPGSFTNSAELYDPAYGTWLTTGPMNFVRAAHNALLLSDGQILVTGGYNGSSLSSTDLYNCFPIVTSFSKSIYENSNIIFSTSDFTSNFSAIPGASLVKIQILSLPANGILKLFDTVVTVNQEIKVSELGNLSFTPAIGWVGTTSFNWNGSDGGLYATNLANVNITVNDQPPILKDGYKFGCESNSLRFIQSDFTNNFNGFCGNSLAKVKIISLPSYGTLNLTASEVNVNQEVATQDLGGLTFIPMHDWTGGTNFKWNGNDGFLYATNSANMNIIVNNLPTLKEIDKSAYENNIITFAPTDFTNSFTSYCGNNLSKIQIVSLPANGALGLSGSAVTINQEIPTADLGNLTFTPTTGWLGATSFQWNGNDGVVYSTNPAKVNIIINDQAPTVKNISKTANKDSAITFTQTDFNNSFSGYAGNRLAKIKIILLPNYGILRLANTTVAASQEITANDLGRLTYTPIAGYIGSDSFGWSGSDGTMYSLSGASVNIVMLDNTNTNWASTPQGIATIVGSVVGGTASLIGAVYTIHKCKQDKSFCFKEKPIADEQGNDNAIDFAHL